SKNNTLYVSKHDPFLNFLSVQQSRAELLKIEPDTQLNADLLNGPVPNFALISPDECHDMHGGLTMCPGASKPLDSNDLKLIAAGDTYASNIVSMIMG